MLESMNFTLKIVQFFSAGVKSSFHSTLALDAIPGIVHFSVTRWADTLVDSDLNIVENLFFHVWII